MSDLVPIREDVVFAGAIIDAGREWVRYADGTEVVRDRVWHPGAVAILAVDVDKVWLVRQPREAIRVVNFLEIPAGKRDVADEPPLQTAKRELAEEIGMQAETWRELSDFYPTPGFADEHVILYLATGLSPARDVEHPDEDERIEVVGWPLAELDQAIASCHDAKSLVALLWLARDRDRDAS